VHKKGSIHYNHQSFKYFSKKKADKNRGRFKSLQLKNNKSRISNTALIWSNY